LREATNEFMYDEQEEFVKKFKKNQWGVYYEKNIAQPVSFNNFYKI